MIRPKALKHYHRLLFCFPLIVAWGISVPALFAQDDDKFSKPFSVDGGFLLLTGGVSHISNIGGEIGVGTAYVEEYYSLMFSTYVAGAATLEVTDLDGSVAFAPRLSVWTSYPLVLVVAGVGVGYYTSSENSGWMLQPEIGLNLTILKAMWRWDVPLGANSPWGPSNGINVKIQVPIAEMD